jgi:hypothetical protein
VYCVRKRATEAVKTRPFASTASTFNQRRLPSKRSSTWSVGRTTAKTTTVAPSPGREFVKSTCSPMLPLIPIRLKTRDGLASI